MPEAPGRCCSSATDDQLRSTSSTTQYIASTMSRRRHSLPRIFPASTNTPRRHSAGPQGAVDILNSARPSAPAFLYADLCSNGQPPGNARRDGSHRLGGGLRLYLDRPWYSRRRRAARCAVPRRRPSPPGGPTAKIATVWAADPVLRAAEPPAVATSAGFPAASVVAASALSLPEQQTPCGGRPRVLSIRSASCGIATSYRLRRGYWPFIRLSLARFQPKSVKDAHLSAVQLTGFIQLPPTRAPRSNCRAFGQRQGGRAGPRRFRSDPQLPEDRHGQQRLNEVELILGRR